MMMAAEMQARLQRCEHVVDDRLACVETPRFPSCRRLAPIERNGWRVQGPAPSERFVQRVEGIFHDDEGARRLMCHQDVGRRKLLACLGFVADEMPSLVVALLER